MPRATHPRYAKRLHTRRESAAGQRRRLRLEPLEDRRMLATFSVTNLSDGPVTAAGDLPGSLRQAVFDANQLAGVDTIDLSAVQGSLLMSAGEFEITEGAILVGPGQNDLTIDADDNSRIFNFTDPADDLTLSGMTLRDGRLDADSERGAGVRSASTGTLTIEHASIISNVTIGVDGNGAGVFTLGDAVLTGLTLRSNNTFGNLSSGGGIFAQGDLTLNDSLVSFNDAQSSGGGVLTLGDLSVFRSTFRSNDSKGNGGGAVVGGGTTNIIDSTFHQNTSTLDGGALWAPATNATIRNSTLSGNSGGDDVGAVLAGTVLLTNSTVTNNRAVGVAGEGGGIVAYNSLVLENSIVAGNTATLNYPDLRLVNAGTLSATSSLVGDRTGTALVEAQSADAQGNLIGDSNGLGVIDPMLQIFISDNGGPTLTHALLPGSPAIDAGASDEAHDQRGAPFLRSAGGGVDIGAYERQTLDPSLLVVTTTKDEPDFSDGELGLREAISNANGSIGSDTISFDPVLFATPQTIKLTDQLPQVVESLIIDGPGAELLTLDAGDGDDGVPGTGDGFRHFIIADYDSSNEFLATISGMTLTGGDESVSGGAILNLENLTVTDSAISGNSAGDSDLENSYGGGGISSTGTLTIANSSVSGNNLVTYEGSGGGIYSRGSLTINNSTIEGNSAIGDYPSGGGISAREDVTITNSTVSGNSTVLSGGGIRAQGDLTLISSTVTGNSGSTGGGVRVSDSSSSPGLTILNSIVAANTGGSAPDVRPDPDGMVAVDYSLIGDTSGSSITAGTGVGNLLNQSAGLGPLQDNGGPTKTHALSPGSPAIDAGGPSVLFDPMEFDQRGAGFFRVGDGGGAGLRIDIGAFEIQTPPPELPGDYNLNGTVDAADYTLWRDALGQSVLPYANADGDGDALVTQADYDVWRTNFGMTLPAAAEAESLPEVTSADGPVPIDAGFALLLAPEPAAQEPSRVVDEPAIAVPSPIDDGLLLLLDTGIDAAGSLEFDASSEALGEEGETGEDEPLALALAEL